MNQHITKATVAAHPPHEGLPHKVRRRATINGSSALRRAAYNRRGTLTLAFTDGTVYAFRDVPPAVYRELVSAESAGAYFNRAIRPRFAMRRLGYGRRVLHHLAHGVDELRYRRRIA